MNTLQYNVCRHVANSIYKNRPVLASGDADSIRFDLNHFTESSANLQRPILVGYVMPFIAYAFLLLTVPGICIRYVSAVYLKQATYPIIQN